MCAIFAAEGSRPLLTSRGTSKTWIVLKSKFYLCTYIYINTRVFSRRGRQILKGHLFIVNCTFTYTYTILINNKSATRSDSGPIVALKATLI